MQIKTTMRNHITPVRTANIQKTKNNKCCWGCREKGILMHWVEIYFGASTTENSMNVP